MATTAEVEFLARVDIAERVGAWIERQAALWGDAPATDADLAELFRSVDAEPSAPAAPALVPCDGCAGSGTMWFGSGPEMEQVPAPCVACGGEGQVEPEEEPDEPAAGEPPFEEPDPPTPAASNVLPFRPRPFDRGEHCRRIAAGGGVRTLNLYGAQHFRTIGKAGARATIARHGVGTVRGIVAAKGWAGPRRPDLAADLALGEYLADAA